MDTLLGAFAFAVFILAQVAAVVGLMWLVSDGGIHCHDTSESARFFILATDADRSSIGSRSRTSASIPALR